MASEVPVEDKWKKNALETFMILKCLIMIMIKLCNSVKYETCRLKY